MRPHPTLLATGTLLAVCLVSSGAHAFCRSVTAAPPPGYDPAAQGCFAPASGSNSYELYWKNLCVGYSLQKDASPLRHITLDQATQVAARAFGSWTGATCSGGAPSVQASNLGPVACGLVQYNSSQPNQHVIVFRDEGWPYNDSSNTLGLTTITFDATDGEIFDADTELNSHDYDLVAQGPVPIGGYDLASVLTHEAGHFLGLAHSGYTGAVMYARYRPGESALTEDDVHGICAIFPHDGTRTTSSGLLTGEKCDPTPRHGFSTTCASEDGGDVEQRLSADASVPVSSSACAVAGGAGAGSLATGPWLLVSIAVTAFGIRRHRPRRARRSARPWAAAVGICLTVASAATATRDAGASVSISVLFEDLVREASAVAVVTPVEQHAAWENGRIFTRTRVHVDRLVAGELGGDLWVRTMGGVVGPIGQVVEGEASFGGGQPSLVFLRQTPGALEVVARAQGQLAVVVGNDKKPRLLSAADVGALVPPPPERAAHLEAAGVAPRLARDVLQGRELGDAASDVARAWARTHAR